MQKNLTEIQSGDIIDIITPQDGAPKFALVHQIFHQRDGGARFTIYPIQEYARKNQIPNGKRCVPLKPKEISTLKLRGDRTWVVFMDAQDFKAEKGALIGFHETKSKNGFINKFLAERDEELECKSRNAENAVSIDLSNEPTHVRERKKASNSTIIDISLDDLAKIENLPQLKSTTLEALKKAGIKRLSEARNALACADGYETAYLAIREVFENQSNVTIGLADLSNAGKQVQELSVAFSTAYITDSSEFSNVKTQFDKATVIPRVQPALDPDITIHDSLEMDYVENEKTIKFLSRLQDRKQCRTLGQAVEYANDTRNKAPQDIIDDLNEAWEVFQENVAEQPKEFTVALFNHIPSI